MPSYFNPPFNEVDAVFNILAGMGVLLVVCVQKRIPEVHYRVLMHSCTCTIVFSGEFTNCPQNLQRWENDRSGCL